MNVTYLTTRKTTVRSKHGGDGGNGGRDKPRKGMIELYGDDSNMVGIDACVPAKVAAQILVIAEKAGVVIR
jgi:hypothetical protein